MTRDITYFPPREYRDARAWALASDQLFQTTPIVPSDTAGSFRLRAEMMKLGRVRLAHLESGPYLNERFPVEGQQVDPMFILDLQRVGRSRIEQHGQITEIGPGDFSITDASRPYRREYLEARNQVLVIQFPQQMLTLPPRALAHILGTSFSGSAGLAAIMSRFLDGIADNLAALQEPLGLTMIDSVIDVVSTLVTGRTSVGGEAGDSAWQLLEIRDYIMEHLGDPDLTPERIARANYISLRQLHALFAKSGSTVAAWIRDRRLEMCRRELSDPRAANRTVREISDRWGFSNQTYFAKVFRATYGYSPTAARRREP
ncbi:helix-turn-helix domain-containing protein [Leucobacter soli]|uniref:HTH araC/xylS-type domain-containing protein n=2 Tax=Bacteria TaxID=2 RepID=A0A916JUQ6_9MICO|nr:helix-turn-helix domain-containing protein [Leucobacter soli]CAG7600397.1 hypothetical protein LEUCIP111803_00384 [Leucobacter soli]